MARQRTDEEEALALGFELRSKLQEAVGDGRRNVAYAELDSEDEHHWRILVGMGLAKEGPIAMVGDERIYTVVDPRPWVRR
jgi:hypothetical protein